MGAPFRYEGVNGIGFHYIRIKGGFQWKKAGFTHYEQGVNFLESAGYTVEKRGVVV